MKVLLAGAQGSYPFKDLVHVGKHSEGKLQILMSYFYIRKQSRAKQTEMLEAMKEIGAWCMLDSGAHTYFSFAGDSAFHGSRDHIASQTHSKEKSKKDYVPPEQYVREYRDWLIEFGHYFATYVELDIDAVVGYDKIIEWREDFVAHGLKPMPVVHKSWADYYAEIERPGEDVPESWKIQVRLRELEKLCESGIYDYIGFEGGWTKDEYLDFLKVTNKHKIRTHGFAMTNNDVFRYLTFYSVDSTSWMAGQQFGVTYVIEGDVLKTKTDKAVRTGPKFVEQCERYEISHDDLVADVSRAVSRYNASIWVDYQKVIEWQHRNDPIIVALGEGPEIIVAPMPVVREKDPEADVGRWCDRCYIADKCPYYQPEATCSVPFDTAGGDADVDDPVSMLKVLRKQVFERLQYSMTVERIKGGLIDPMVTKDIDSFVSLCQKIENVISPMESIKIEAKGPGLLSQLFGGYGRSGGSSPASKLGVEDPSPLRALGKEEPFTLEGVILDEDQHFALVEDE